MLAPLLKYNIFLAANNPAYSAENVNRIVKASNLTLLIINLLTVLLVNEFFIPFIYFKIRK